ncbi:MAG: DoxX family protein [Bacteroidetes bacterium]|jgi:uncharacterized membrane protein YphA (DoxX/SURF4 family)|nr:DoxX family protein [Bacteroidota bacterium]
MQLAADKANRFLIIPRLIVGLIFLSEGIQKFVTPTETGVGRFAKIGFSHPQFWAYFTGSFEIVCALFIIIGVTIRFAVIPLLVIMIVASITTKFPILTGKGFWSFAHEYRTDFAVSLLLVMLLLYSWSENSNRD